MKLITVPSSPFGRKVLVAAAELGLRDRIEVVHDNPWKAETRVPELNPVGKVPALRTDDGLALYGSGLICEYLDAQGSPPLRLFPPPGPARWLALRRQELADQATEAFVAVRLERNRQAGEQSPGWIMRKLAVLGRCLDALEAEGLGAEDPPTIGHVAAAVLLGHLDFRRAATDGDWRAARPSLAAWHAVFSQRPSMLASAPHD